LKPRPLSVIVNRAWRSLTVVREIFIGPEDAPCNACWLRRSPDRMPDDRS
jgi:hypothetical protein